MLIPATVDSHCIQVGALPHADRTHIASPYCRSKRISLGVTCIRPKTPNTTNPRDNEYAPPADFVRITGAVNEEGKLWDAINGDYARTEEVRNQRPLYEKVGNSETCTAKGLWCDFEGRWTVGELKNAGKDVGYATTTEPTWTSSPERACVATGKGAYIHIVSWMLICSGGRWERQEEMLVTAISEEDATSRRPSSSLSRLSAATTRPRSHNGRWCVLIVSFQQKRSSESHLIVCIMCRFCDRSGPSTTNAKALNRPSTASGFDPRGKTPKDFCTLSEETTTPKVMQRPSTASGMHSQMSWSENCELTSTDLRTRRMLAHEHSLSVSRPLASFNGHRVSPGEQTSLEQWGMRYAPAPHASTRQRFYRTPLRDDEVGAFERAACYFESVRAPRNQRLHLRDCSQLRFSGLQLR